MRLKLIILLITLSQFISAQSISVHSKTEFAGITLHFNSAARKKIQNEVDRIRKNPTYFQKHVDQANLYFPLIEEIFKENQLPLDFKYLIIQESAFKANAVSSSKAVGYWQFKEGTAKEVGMRVGDGIDERKNIYAATKGAAKYITKTNQKLDNWIYALLSYNVGPGGVMSYYKKTDEGVSKMEITSKMHWYVIKLLAHKIAFENEIGKSKSKTVLSPDFGYAGKNLKQIANTNTIDLEILEQYNLWISKNKKIPSDKEYAVVLPIKRDLSLPHNPTVTINSSPSGTKNTPIVSSKAIYKTQFDPKKNITLDINNIPVITAKENDQVGQLALKAGVSNAKFAKYNEITVTTPLVPGVPYFTRKKKSKAIISFYTVKPGEDLWTIAQKYGVTTFSIITKNRMSKTEPLLPGRVLYLRKIRPDYIPVEIKESVQEVKPQAKKVTVLDSLKNKVINDLNIPKEAVEPKESPIEGKVTEAQKDTIIKVDLPRSSNNITHTISKNETFYSISKKYTVSIDEIKKANKLSEQPLSVGQRLTIPNVNNKEKKELLHTVEKGDTMYSIARAYNIKVQNLMKWNNKQTTDLTLGEELKIIQD